MQNAQVSNPNDFKVVSFHNSTSFGFTPEMGCMYDSRAINGKDGKPGIAAGETMVLPYHVGHQLAINLAKRVLNTSPSATVDAAGVPTGVPIWSDARLQEVANGFMKDLYTEEKPVPRTETDLLMAKVEEYKSLVEKLIPQQVTPVAEPSVNGTAPKVYLDKQEVIAELDKRGVKHDKRKNKAELEKLLI